jgi:Cu/Ag efflux protein CusF
MKLARTLAAAAVAALLLTGATAHAAETFLGTVEKITPFGARAAKVLLKSEEGKTVEVVVDDAITLEKFKDKRIKPGDEIKARYEEADGKKHATYFKKPGGC